MRYISSFSTRFPVFIIFLALGITVFFAYQIKTKAYTESDTTKFLPTDMKTVKANDYYRKNFSYNDSLIIGIEAPEKGIMNRQVLRTIESIVDRISVLRITREIDSKITGKRETVVLPMGIDTDDITSISGLEDAIMDRETGAVITGSVIKKLKKEAGIPYTDENEGRLPESDGDLVKIIPDLKQHILKDRLFRGNLLSNSENATAIHIPMINKWEYKQRYATLELETAIEPAMLKARFSGNDSTFPHDVFGKTIDGTAYDDAFIAAHTARVRKELKGHLTDYLSPAFDTYPRLEELLAQELTGENFREIMKISREKSFFMHSKMTTWDIFTSKLYDFTLEHIDPLSLENLSFQLPDVNHIYDLLVIYDHANEILEEESGEGIKTYIAGMPVVFSVMSRIIDKDMGMLMPMGVIVIFIILAVSFRSSKGVVIPLVTVVISVIWALGMMALTGTPITTSTSIIPIILLAVGSAYGIHFLNRYNEDAKQSDDRRKVLRLSIEGVGVAIIMAGMTTFLGFLSLSSSKLLMIRHFSLFSAFGICVALLLTLTLSPALLCFWKLPKKEHLQKKEKEGGKTGKFDAALMNWAKMVRSAPKTALTVFILLSIGAGILMKDLQFEGGVIEDFKEDNPLRISDEFINKNLTGTGEISFLFKFRDSVNLDNEWIVNALKERSNDFASAWDSSPGQDRLIRSSPIQDLRNRLVQLVEDPAPNAKELETTISLFRDIMNEEYMVEVEMEADQALESDSDMDALFEENEEVVSDDDLLSLADEGSGEEDDLTGLADDEDLAEAEEGPFVDYSPEQVAGLKDLNQRLNPGTEEWEATAEAILRLRDLKNTDKGQVLMKRWNLLQDLFAADIKQPRVLHKLEEFRNRLVAMDSPKVNLNGDLINPTGFVSGPVDMIRKTYSVFYHDEDPAFKKIPDTRTDNLSDPTLTDRGVIGVVLNQAQNSNRDAFEGMISPDLKEFQFSIMARNSTTSFASSYLVEAEKIFNDIFPEDDPYIESVAIGGQVPVMMEIMNMIVTSQVTSILQAMVFVFIITFFIFRSALGGLYSLIPLTFTILANFGMIILLGWKINTGTVMVASISIGIGVDYTIHFLERFKMQLKAGDPFDLAYFNTIRSVGKAILINAISVAFGFIVLLASDMGGTQSMGILMFGTMAYSSLAALTLLPAVIFVTKPRFLTKVVEQNGAKEIATVN